MEQLEFLKARVEALQIELERVNIEKKNLKMQLAYCQQQNFKR
jgi:hypothetical protein